MKKTDLYLISEGFLFLALGSYVNEDWLISVTAFTLSAVLMVLLMITGESRRADGRDVLIVFMIQLLITLSTFSSHTLLPCLMVNAVSVIQLIVLSLLSSRSRKVVTVFSLSAVALVFLAVVLAHIFISAVFHTREVMAVSYLPMLAMLSVPYLYRLAEGFRLHHRHSMQLR